MKNDKLVIIVSCFDKDKLTEYSIDELLMFLDAIINEGLVSAESKILFINNSSSMKTVDIISSYCKNNDRVEFIDLNNNGDPKYTYFAGIYTKDADMYVTLDADSQEDYLLIIEMIEKFYEGYDVIYGFCKNHRKYSFFNKSVAKLFYKFINLLGIKIKENYSDTILLSRNAVDKLKEYKGRTIFLNEIIKPLGLKSFNIYNDKTLRTTEKLRANCI